MEEIRAYHDCYVPCAKECLGNVAEYAIDACGLDADWFFALFVQSRYAQLFAHGNPAVIAGMAGDELAQRVLDEAYGLEAASAAGNVVYACLRFDRELGSWIECEPFEPGGLSPAYWAGWALAEYQWKTARSFESILSAVPFSEIASMYPLFHEMDIEQFIEAMELKMSARLAETRLSVIRKNRGMTQSQLAHESGVNVRSIQMYEQRVNDIDRAQANTLSRLANVLGCSIQDLLEHPLAS